MSTQQCRRWRRLWIPICLFLAFPVAAADPSFYQKKATWQDTMLASLEGLAASGIKDGFAPYESPTMRGGDPTRQVVVPVSGAGELHLFVTGCPDVKWGVADWAEATLVRTDDTTQPLTNAFRVRLGRHAVDLTLRSGLNQKLQIAERQFDRGLNVQADSAIVVPLDGKYATFHAWIGVDAWAGSNGNVRFSVVGPRAAARKQLLELVARDFSTSTARRQIAWEREDRIYERDWTPGDWPSLAVGYAQACRRLPPLADQAAELLSDVQDKAGMEAVRAIYYRARALEATLAKAKTLDCSGLRAAFEDLQAAFPDKFPARFLPRLKELETALAAALEALQVKNLESCEKVARLTEDIDALKQEALLANPLLEFGRLLVIQRRPIGDPRRSQWEGYGPGEYVGMPRQSSWNYGTMPNLDHWTNQVAVLSPARPSGQLQTLFRPDSSSLLADLDPHWDSDRILFSMADAHKKMQVCEIHADGTAFRQLTPSLPDVHNYSPIYLPSGDILFLSTAPLQGVPCNAGVIVGMLYKMGPNGEHIRQVTFEQDHDYTPSVLNDGRVLYLRWDYTDTPHVWNRLLMSMNPDGTSQTEYYGANSYWPNAIFFARPIPNHPTKIVGIVTGHHEGRVGELFLFDPALGRHETNGVVQRIPASGPPVTPKIEDKLTEHSWPKFLHPWPLSDKYFLVACKPEPDSLWGIYLVDVFDNLVLLKEEEGLALLEPRPLLKRTRPPVLQDRTQPDTNSALVYLDDVYRGPGLRGVPRGTVKQLRLFTYQFGYQTLAGIDHRVGADGPWEPKRILGTVPVEPDGSASFTVPAKTPLSLQPLDAEGNALALMRSWMTAMPGERVSCVGCHDNQNTAPSPSNQRLALGRPPSPITPWRGPARGFSFLHEVQPVLDKYCVGCHNGQPQPGGQTRPDLRRDQGGYMVYRGGELNGTLVRGVPKQDLLGKYGAVFEPSYVVLRQYVRVGGLESDLHLLPPGEFHADTSELIRMLQKGHHQVKLDADAWDRLVTWIDLNAPCHGRWSDVTRIPGNQSQRRLELRQLYGGLTENWEDPPAIASDAVLPKPIIPESPALPEDPLAKAPGFPWPLSTQQAQQQQTATGTASSTVDLGEDVSLQLVRIPAGRFIMGDAGGEQDERPLTAGTIGKPFWMAKTEISNRQFAQFDPNHDSRFEHRSSWIFSEEYLGWPLNRPQQPVVRVSWEEATAFCRWLSQKLGRPVALPTEAQWEYACRAGTDTPLHYGNLDTDFSNLANLGDTNLYRLADEGWRPKAPDLIPRDARSNDRALVTAEVGQYLPNPWGLLDMHGNAAEWTRSTYRPYPYVMDDGRDNVSPEGRKVVRGGSWRDRPKFCRSASRVAYPPYRKVFNVGFRIVIED